MMGGDAFCPGGGPQVKSWFLLRVNVLQNQVPELPFAKRANLLESPSPYPLGQPEKRVRVTVHRLTL